MKSLIGLILVAGCVAQVQQSASYTKVDLLSRTVAPQHLPFHSPTANIAKLPNADDQFVSSLYSATALLYSQDDSGGMKMICTATAIEKLKDGYRFVSASHCACDDDMDKEVVKPQKSFFFITADNPGEKEFMPAKLYACGFQHESDDFSLFDVKTDKVFPVIPIGKDVVDNSGEPIINIASPQGLGRQTLHGFVSSPKLDRAVIEGDINWTGAMILQLPNTAGGSSGSTVASPKQHAIVGFVVGHNDNSIIAIPVSRFTKFYEEVKAGKYQYASREK
jgi:hypothetical protein